MNYQEEKILNDLTIVILLFQEKYEILENTLTKITE